jgi:hypothetical protein
VGTIQALLERDSSGSGLENLNYGRKDLPRSPPDSLYPKKFGTNFTDKQHSLGRHISLAD